MGITAVMEWMLLAIFIFGTLSSNELNLPNMKKKKNELWPIICKRCMKNEKKTNENQYASLHLALQNGDEKLVNFLLNIGGDDKEKLIENVMKENEFNETALHYASKHGQKEIVKSLLNAFGEEDNKKLIEYVMKEDEFKETALDHAFERGDEEIVKYLLNVFDKKEKEKGNEKLIKVLMKENKFTLHYASK